MKTIETEPEVSAFLVFNNRTKALAWVLLEDKFETKNAIVRYLSERNTGRINCAGAMSSLFGIADDSDIILNRQLGHILKSNYCKDGIMQDLQKIGFGIDADTFFNYLKSVKGFEYVNDLPNSKEDIFLTNYFPNLPKHQNKRGRNLFYYETSNFICGSKPHPHSPTNRGI